MKVCHVITRLIVGGAQENTVNSCIGLIERGYDVDLVIGPQTGPEGSLARQAREAGVPILVVEEMRRALLPWHDALACRALWRLFKEKRYNMVHTHSGKAGFLGRLAAKRAGVPMIVHTIHGPSFYKYQNPVGNLVFRSAEQLAGKWTTHFVSVADAMSEQYLAAGIGCSSQYTTIRSGMDTAAFVRAQCDAVLRAKLGIGAGDKVVGKVARLFKLKGHEYLIEAAPRIVAAVPNVKFLLVGDGSYRDRFERAVTRMGLRDRFVFAGLVAPAEIPAYMAQMDVLAHLSLREGLPRTLPQALATGKPVVAFDVDGAREVCRTNETGFLVKAEDVDGLVDAVIRLLQDQTLADKLGANGRELVQEQFTNKAMVDQLDLLYRRLAKQSA